MPDLCNSANMTQRFSRILTTSVVCRITGSILFHVLIHCVTDGSLSCYRSYLAVKPTITCQNTS